MAWHSPRSNAAWGQTIRDQVIDEFEDKYKRSATAEEIAYATKVGKEAAEAADRRDRKS